MSQPFEQSSALAAISAIRHGFYGRRGGVSQGDFASNNMSYIQTDSVEATTANRRQVTAAMQFESDALCVLKQVHSATVRVVTGRQENPASHVGGSHPFEADAMVTNVPGLLLGILTADCTPILFADPEAGVIGATHAGWRGAAHGICEATVDAMVRLGADPARIIAAIGPTISGANYQVGPQFVADELKLYPNARNRVFVPEGDVEHFDLPGFVEDCLRDTGVLGIDRVGGCTYSHPDRYFSHRYATHHGTRTGRQIAVIGLT